MPSSAPFVIGLTGNIATGKSTVLAWLAKRGAHVLDADKLTHAAMAPGGPAYQAVLQTFGAELATDDGTIDRKALGAIVFADASALKKLEAIIHPAVFELAREAILHSQASVVVLEAIKLLDGGATYTLCDEVWVVTASQETQLQRLKESRGMERAEALVRMQAQSSQEYKVSRADRVIQNDGSPAELDAQLEMLWQEVVQKC
ncbi:MAG: dephospho-CoA kinase [Caldilineaceae bacterium]